MSAGGDPNRDRWRSTMIQHFQAATMYAAVRSSTPRWRWRKRRKLERDLDLHCRKADLALKLLGAGPDARPLRSIIDEALER